MEARTSLKGTVLRDKKYTAWQLEYGKLICPHGNHCKDYQQKPHQDCRCISPLVKEGFV